MAHRNEISPRPKDVNDSVMICSGKPGPVVAIFGGIHGNERCGLLSIRRLLFDFATRRRTLKRGILLMAEGNREAAEFGMRCTTYNLNRLFREDYDDRIDRSCYEYQRAQQLKSLLQLPQYFLDLHSTSTAGESFFLTSAPDAPFFKKVGGAKIVTGWNKFATVLGGTTEAYARAQGAVSATFEAGQHDSACTMDVAYRTAARFLTVVGVTSEEEGDYRYEDCPEVFDLTGMWTKRTADCRYVRDVRNFMPIKSEPDVVCDGAMPEEYPRGEYVIMPTSNPAAAHIGEEIYFVGDKVG